MTGESAELRIQRLQDAVKMGSEGGDSDDGKAPIINKAGMQALQKMLLQQTFQVRSICCWCEQALRACCAVCCTAMAVSALCRPSL
jgi:hypothetical protein